VKIRTTQEWRELVEAAQENEGHLNLLIEESIPLVWKFIGDQNLEPQDVWFHELYIHLPHAVKMYRGGCAWPHWVKRVLFWKMCNILKVNRATKRGSGAEHVEFKETHMGSCEHFYCGSDDLRPLLECLTKKQRKAVEMFYLKGYTRKETAKALGIHPNNVYYLLDRAVERMGMSIWPEARIT